MAKRSKPDPRRAHLRLEEFSDRELLLAVDDACQASGEGWASARDVAAQIGLSGTDPHLAVAQRLRYQQQYGSVDREFVRDETGNIRYHRDGRPMHTQNWRLTEIGHQLAYATLRKADETALGRLQDAQMVVVARWLSGRTIGNGASPTTSKLVEREWRYGMAQRRR